MFLSSTILSLLVALISVLVVAIPNIDKALIRNAADIRFIFLENDKDHIAVLASNQGRKPGVVSGALLSGHNLSRTEAFSWRLTPEPRYVAPSESITLLLRSKPEEEPLPSLYLRDDFDYSVPATTPWHLSLNLEITQIDGSIDLHEILFAGLRIFSKLKQNDAL